MRIRLLTFLCACIVGSGLAVLVAQSPLTLQQLLRLIAASTPDRIVAAELSERGLRDVIDRALIETVRRGGAGPSTLGALEKIRPRATLTIRGVPGTNIAIDGASGGRIGQDGVLALRDMWPGRHDVAAELFDHNPERRTVTLVAKQSADLELLLKSVYGFLSLSTSASRATIHIEGQSQFRSPLSKHRLKAGRYVLRVEAPYREPHTETLEIRPGDSLERHVVLTPDRGQLEFLLVRAGESYSNRNYRAATSEAAEYVEAMADFETHGKATALSYLALAQLQLREYSNAATTGRLALNAGAVLALDVVHHHGSGLLKPHTARLVISTYRMLYEPVERCTFRTGSVDSTRVNVQYLRNARLSMLGIPSPGGVPAIEMKFPKPNEPEESVTLNFIDENVTRLETVFEILEASTARSIPSGALDSSSLPGRYTRRDGTTDFIDLKTDGTFATQQQGQILTGTFSVAGDVITVRSGRRSETARVEGTDIVDAQGLVWEKAPNTRPD